MPESRSRRVTKGPAPVPAKRRPKKSPQWWAPAFLGTMALGVLVIVLNYMEVLPGAVSPAWLLVGFAFLIVGFWMATRWR